MEFNINLGYKNYLLQILVFLKCLQTNSTAVTRGRGGGEQRRATHIALIPATDEIRNLGMRILRAERYDKSLVKIIPHPKLTGKKKIPQRCAYDFNSKCRIQKCIFKSQRTEFHSDGLKHSTVFLGVLLHPASSLTQTQGKQKTTNKQTKPPQKTQQNLPKKECLAKQCKARETNL